MQTQIKNTSLLPTPQNSTTPKGDRKTVPVSRTYASPESEDQSTLPDKSDTTDSQTGDTGTARLPKLGTETTTTASFLTPLDALNEMEKVQAIGELSRLNNQLDTFVRNEIQTFDAASTPPTQKELLEKWNKLNPTACSSPDIQTWADREIFQKLDQARITLTRNHDLTRINDARKNWNIQLEQARSKADEDSVLHWEQLGKGVFYPDQEEPRQKEISRRFSDYKTIQELMTTQPARALEYLQAPNTRENLPPSVKSYWETQARKNLAEKQGNFYKTLIENELKGTPYREDLLEQAEQQQLISPERKKAYLERFTEERPLRNETSLSLPFTNALYNLIHTYSPDRDVKGERKRSIYALIAESDCEPEEKGNLIRQFARQRNNPELARLRNTAAAYLQERYERDGFGEFTPLPTPTDAQTAEDLRSILAKSKEKAWLTSEKKWASAQKAFNEYLEEHQDNLPTRQEWQTLIPTLLYKATRTPKRLFTEDAATFRGYPLLVKNRVNISQSSTPQEKEPTPSSSDSPTTTPPTTWQDTLTRYFSTHMDNSPRTIRNDLKSLYSQWLNRNKNTHSRHTPMPSPPEIPLI